MVTDELDRPRGTTFVMLGEVEGRDRERRQRDTPDGSSSARLPARQHPQGGQHADETHRQQL